jgi:adenosylmethionine-8-amino-7-oxononanoate aminotransferase
MTWYEYDRAHAWHPYTQMLTAPPPIPVESAKDATIYTSDGRALLDAISSWWVLLHGHSNSRIADAISEQARRLDQVIFAGFTHEPASRLAKALAELTPGNLDRVFYSDNGSTAVEVALKMALQFWRNQGREKRRTFLSLEGAYHGDTVGAMSVSGVELFGSHFEPLLFDVLRAENPLCPEKAESVDALTATRVCTESMERHLSDHPDEIAAVIIEPMVQGAGGMIIWPSEFLRKVREICDRHDVLLIADEVFTGFGRTGKLFACEHGPIVPDILCASKAITGGVLPLAATVTHARVYDAFLSEDREKTLFHGHSFTANPIACAAALESLAILRENGLGRVGGVEAFQRERLARLRELPIVRDANALGLIARIELEGSGRGYLDDLGPRLARELLARDIILRPLGNVLYTVPPLCITDDELTRIWDAIDEVLVEINCPQDAATPR